MVDIVMRSRTSHVQTAQEFLIHLKGFTQATMC